MHVCISTNIVITWKWNSGSKVLVTGLKNIQTFLHQNQISSDQKKTLLLHKLSIVNSKAKNKQSVYAMGLLYSLCTHKHSASINTQMYISNALQSKMMHYIDYDHG